VILAPSNGAADNPLPVLGSVLVPYKVLVVGCNPALYVPLLAPVHTLAGARHHAPYAAFLAEERVTGNTFLGARGLHRLPRSLTLY
jgi:hypothetical protein